jgi:arylsulfatase A-like enzyme
MPAGTFTIGKMLQEQGYVTGAFGKWGLGFIDTEGDPNSQGIDEFFGFNCQSLAHNYYPDHLWHNREKVLLHENDSGKIGAYSARVIHDSALKFIEKNSKKPFCLFYTTTIPHAELFAQEKYMQMFRGKFLPEKQFKGTDDGPTFRLGPYGSQPESHAAWAAMITQLDDYVGEIIARLKELGLEENTIVMFASDNGPHLEAGADPDFFNSNGDLRGYKRDMYDGGIRTAFLVKWPGKIIPGSKSDHVSAFWDLMPTLSEITRAEMTSRTDGISFLPILTGKGEQKKHDYLYWEFHEQGGKTGVRMDNWKAIRLNVDKNPDSPVELYDISSDIGETKNIAAEHPDIVKRAEQIMKEAHIPSVDFPFAYEKKK